MRIVVAAVTKIDQDVQATDARRIAALPPAEQDLLRSLESKMNATLSNLLTATKNHATSFGVLPVSLVDAAASHLSSAVVDIIRILRIKRTGGNLKESNGDIRPVFASVKSNGSTTTSLNSARGIPPREDYGSSSKGRKEDARAYVSPPESERHEDREREEDRYRQQQSISPNYASTTSSSYTPTPLHGMDSRGRYDEHSPRGTIQPEDSRREDGYGQNQYGSHTRAGSVLTYGSPNPAQTEWPELKVGASPRKS